MTNKRPLIKGGERYDYYPHHGRGDILQIKALSNRGFFDGLLPLFWLRKRVEKW